jgi:hypothetical protein
MSEFMFDGDDVSDFALWGPGGLVGLILLIILLFIVCGNEEECSKRTCPTGQVSALMEHECLCVTKAKKPE